MENLRSRIYKAIDERRKTAGKFQKEQYEDNYDGFTHSSYSGLASAVEDELINEGYDENVSYKTIKDFVYEMF